MEWFGAEEAELPLDIVSTADESFLTSSTRDVHPLTTVDDRHWVSIGNVVADLVKEFHFRAASDIDP